MVAAANTDYTKDAFNFIGSPVSATDRSPAQQSELAYLIENGYLTQTKGDSEGAGAVYDWGATAPKNFSGYGTNNAETGAAANPALRLWSADQAVPAKNGDGTSLINPKAVANSDIWGNLTPVGNIKHPAPSGLEKALWTIGPMIPALLATIFSGGAASPLIGLMKQAGSTAIGMLGNGTPDTKGDQLFTDDDFGPGQKNPTPANGPPKNDGSQNALSPQLQLVLKLFSGLTGG